LYGACLRILERSLAFAHDYLPIHAKIAQWVHLVIFGF
jgi:hypothetical protein